MTADAPVPIDELLAERAWVRGLAGALVREGADADDLAQDAWQSALRSPPRRGGSVRAWFSTVLRNRARDLRRDASRRAAALPPAAEGDDTLASSQPSPAALAERAETERRVLEVVVSLDEAHRDVVLLRFWRGLGADEIARLRGIAPATARTRLHRALAEVRRRLDRECGGRDAWHAALLPWTAAGTGAGVGAEGATSSGAAGAAAPQDAATSVRIGRGWLVALRAAGAVVLCIVLLALWRAAFDVSPAAGGADVAGAPESSTGESAGKPSAANATRPPRPRAAPPGPVATPTDAAASGASGPGSVSEFAPIVAAVVRVRVEDAAGRAVADAAVSLTNADGAKAAAVVAASARTGADGVAEVHWAGEAASVRALVQSGEQAGTSGRFEIEPGKETETRVRIGAARRVLGVVLRPDGTPFEGAWISLSGSFDDAYEQFAATTSDADGRFDFGPVPLALATKEGAVETAARGFPRVWVALDSAVDASALTIRLDAPMVVTGRLVDEHGKPVPGVSVDVTGASTVLSDRKGRFRSEELKPAAVRVVVIPDDHAPAWVALADAASGVRDVGEIVLAAGAAIRGRVVTADGAPSPRANVYVDDVTVDQIVRQGQADLDGRFVFEHLGSGPHVVHAQAQDGGGAHAGQEGEVADVRAGAEDVRVVVGPGRSVLVLFVDDATGEPVPLSGVKTALLLVGDPNVGARSSYGGDDLRSVRISVRRDGNFELTVEAAGFETFGPVPVEVAGREERQVTARLRRKAR